MMSTIWQIITSIPQIIRSIKALIDFWLDLKRKIKDAENEKVRKQIEDAKTEAERQAALDRASGSFGSH